MLVNLSEETIGVLYNALICSRSELKKYLYNHTGDEVTLIQLEGVNDALKVIEELTETETASGQPEHVKKIDRIGNGYAVLVPVFDASTKDFKKYITMFVGTLNQCQQTIEEIPDLYYR